MSEQEFVAQSLNSRDLLALLFICEKERKGSSLTPENFSKAEGEWNEMIDTFASRFAHLTETLRFEVLEAHLMSVEDLDVYHNETLKRLLDKNEANLRFLTEKLCKDPRFQT